MSRHREMLRALLRVGKTPDDIAAEVPMNPANVARTLAEDWPVQKRYVEPLEVYARRVLLQAHDAAPLTDRHAIANLFDLLFDEPVVGLPRLSEEARRAAYVAWLLRISPDTVFPLGAECTEEADAHLFDVVAMMLPGLIEEARQATDRSPEATRYLSTLSHAADVLEGREDPATNGWYANRRGYRRGTYIFHRSPAPKIQRTEPEEGRR